MTEREPETKAAARPEGAGGALREARELGHVSILALMAVTLPALGGFLLLGSAPALRAWLNPEDPPVPALPALYALAFGLATGLALLPTYALSAVSGYLFGQAGGSAVAMVGVTLGAAIGWVWASRLARDRLTARLAQSEKAEAVRRALVERSGLSATGLVTLLRFPPNSPFALTNLAMGAGGVRFVPFLLGTALGMAPRTILAALIGGAAADLAAALQKNQGPGKYLAIGVSIAAFIAIWIVVSRIAKRAIADLAPAAATIAES